MIIMVQKGLNSISKYLKERGYNVISEDDKLNYYDVFIYSSLSYEGLYNNMISTNLFNSKSTNNVLMINAHNKSYTEIEDIINKRKYSNLFESEGFFWNTKC